MADSVSAGSGSSNASSGGAQRSNLPRGLHDILVNLAQSVIAQQPEDISLFCAQFLERELDRRHLDTSHPLTFLTTHGSSSSLGNPLYIVPLSKGDYPSHFVYNELLTGTATGNKSTYVGVRNIDIAPCSGYPEHGLHCQQQQQQHRGNVRKLDVTSSTLSDTGQAGNLRIYGKPVSCVTATATLPADISKSHAYSPPPPPPALTCVSVTMDKQPSTSKLANSKTHLAVPAPVAKTASQTTNPFWSDMQTPQTTAEAPNSQSTALPSVVDVKTNNTSSKTSVPESKKNQSKDSHHSLHVNQQTPMQQQQKEKKTEDHTASTDQSPSLAPPIPPPPQRKLKKMKRTFPMCCMTDVIEDTSGPPPPLPAPTAAEDKGKDPAHEHAADSVAEEHHPPTHSSYHQLQADATKLATFNTSLGLQPDNTLHSRSMLEENNTWDATNHEAKLRAKSKVVPEELPKCTPVEFPDVKEGSSLPSATRLRPSQELVAVGTTNKAVPSSRHSLPASVRELPQMGSRPSSATQQQAHIRDERRAGDSHPKIAGDGVAGRHNQSSPARLLKDDVEITQDGGVTLHYQPDTSALGDRAPQIEHTVKVTKVSLRPTDDQKTERPGSAQKTVDPYYKPPPPTPPPSMCSKQDTIKESECLGDHKKVEEEKKQHNQEKQPIDDEAKTASLRWEMKAMKGKADTDGLTIDYAMKASYDAKTGDVESSATISAEPKPNSRLQVCSAVQATLKLRSSKPLAKEPLAKISEIFSPLMSPTPAPLECTTRPASPEALSPDLSPFNSRLASPQPDVNRPESPSSPLPVNTAVERDLLSPPCKRRIVSNVSNIAAVYVCACPCQPCDYHQDVEPGPTQQGYDGPDGHHIQQHLHPHHCHANSISASAAVYQTTTMYDDEENGHAPPVSHYFGNGFDTCDSHAHPQLQYHQQQQQPRTVVFTPSHHDPVNESERDYCSRSNTQTTTRRPPVSQHLYQNVPMQASRSNFTVDSQKSLQQQSKHGTADQPDAAATTSDDKSAHLHQHPGPLFQQSNPHSYHQQHQQPGSTSSSQCRARPQSCTGRYHGAGMSASDWKVGLPAGTARLVPKVAAQPQDHPLFPGQQAYAVLNRSGSRIGYFIAAEATSTEDGEHAEAHAFITHMAPSENHLGQGHGQGQGGPEDMYHQMGDQSQIPAATMMMNSPQQWPPRPQPQQTPFVCFEHIQHQSQPCRTTLPAMGHYRTVPVERKASSGSTTVSQQQQHPAPCPEQQVQPSAPSAPYETENNASYKAINRQPSCGTVSKQFSIPSGRFTTADMYSKPWKPDSGRLSQQSQQSRAPGSIPSGNFSVVDGQPSQHSHPTGGVPSGKFTTADMYSKPWSSEGGRLSQQSQPLQQQQQQTQVCSDEMTLQRMAKSQHSARGKESVQNVTRSIHGPHVGSSTIAAPAAAAKTSSSQHQQQSKLQDGLVFSNLSSKQPSLERCSSTKSPSHADVCL